jgi:hypothetical protein
VHEEKENGSLCAHVKIRRGRKRKKKKCFELNGIIDLEVGRLIISLGAVPAILHVLTWKLMM